MTPSLRMRTQPDVPVRSGHMTAAMRAVMTTAGPKVLRIGLVERGKVTEERVLEQRSHVTVGPSEKSMFVLSAKAIPSNHKLFELVGGDYVLNLLEGMTGRIALDTGITDLATLRGRGKRVTLTDDARGKLVIGETTLLFQFVAPPPTQLRPQLPASVKSGVHVDWTTTVIAAFSFLMHFGLVGTIWSDPYDRDLGARALELSQLAEKVAALPAPPPETKEDPDAADIAASTAIATAEAPKEAAKRTSTQGSAWIQPNGAGPKAQMSDMQASRLSSQLDTLNVSMQSVLNGAGESTNDVLDPNSAIPTFDNVSKANVAAGPGSLHMGSPGYSGRPGDAGAPSLAQVGDTGEKDKRADGGEAVRTRGPKTGNTSVGGPAIAGGTVPGAGAVVAGMAATFRACYNHELVTNPDMAGTVRITASIGPAGEVKSVSASGGGSLSGTLIGCVQGRVAGAQFSPPDSGGATLVIPVSFQPGK